MDDFDTETNNSDSVCLNEIDWPPELFYTLQPQQTGVSPASCFKLADAVHDTGCAWGNSTSPLAIPKQKAIVITQVCVDVCSSIVYLVALIRWLQLNGFNLYLCLADTFKPIPGGAYDDTATLSGYDPNALSELVHFDKERYAELAARGEARDHLIVSDSEILSKILDCFNSTDNCIQTVYCFTEDPYDFPSLGSRSSKLRGRPIYEDCLTDCKTAAQQNQLIEKHSKGIHNGYTLARCLAACITAQQQANLIEQHSDKIKDEYTLIRCLEVCRLPEQQADILKNYSKKVSLNYLLAECLAVCKTEKLQKEILEQYSDTIFSEYYLRQCLRILPILLQTAPLLAAKLHMGEQAFSNLLHELNLSKPLDHTQQQNSRVLYKQLALEDDQTLEILEKIRKNEFPYLTVVEIAPQQTHWQKTKKLLSALQECCPHLLHLVLPINLASCIIDSDWIHSVSYSNPFKLNFDDSHTAQFYASKPPNTHAQLIPEAGTLYIANNTFPEDFCDENKAFSQSTFHMVAAGKLLNADTKLAPGIRIGIMQYDFKKRLKSFVIYAANRAKPLVPAPPVLTDAQIACYAEMPADQYFYYQFTQTLQAGEPSRLPSIDAHENFLGFKTNPETKVTITRGLDDFYYATAAHLCLLTYCIQAPHPNQHDYANLSSKDPIKKIIADYKNPEKGYRCDTPENYQTPYHLTQENVVCWAQEVYEQRTGSCGHRVIAVLSEIREKYPKHKNRVRVVAINGNHVRLEIQHNKTQQWIQIDLGGRSCELIFEPTPLCPEDVALSSVGSPAQEDVALPLLTRTISCSSTLAHEIHRQLSNKYTPTPIYDEAQLRQSITTIIDYQPLLLLAGTDAAYDVNVILKYACQTKCLVFYLDSKTAIHPLALSMLPDGKAVIIEQSPLTQFLHTVQRTDVKSLILVNWDAFNARERLTLNTLLDSKGLRAFNGQALPEQMQVISVCSQLPDDTSFLSRHGCLLQSFLVSADQEDQTIQNTQKFKIDLQGLLDWEACLLGEIVLYGNEIRWEKSEFVLYLEEAQKTNQPLQITLMHAPYGKESALRLQLDRAHARGCWPYHGYEIPFPETVQVIYQNEAFDYAKFKKVSVKKEAHYASMPKECRVVNTVLFDYLLHDKAIVNGHYQKTPGWLEAAAVNRQLSLFISSELSKTQWYCLFYRATQLGVTLTLYLAPGVTLPMGLRTRECIENLASMAQEDCELSEHENLNATYLYISNDPDAVCKELKEKNIITDDTPIISVEDYDYSDIMYHLGFERILKENSFRFHLSPSAILLALQAGKSVVLKGEFSDTLRYALQPLLVQKTIELPDGSSYLINGHLLLIMEDTHLKQNQADHPFFTWLPKAHYQIAYYPQRTASFPTILYQETAPDFSVSINLHNSTQKASAFELTRTRALLNALAHHSLLQVIGTAGVGKSTALQILVHEHPRQLTLYQEMENFEAWAKDTCDKTKILLIEEANLTNQHWTIFSPLKPGGNRCLLYQRKLYTLDCHHKVIFIHNSLTKRGHAKQKLYAEALVPKLYFEPLPESFLFARIQEFRV
jgi:hypothetical protein